MSIIVRCPIELKSSGGQNKIGLSSTNNIQVSTTLHVANVSLFGVRIKQGILTPINSECGSSQITSTREFNLELELENNISESDRVKFVEEIESYLTLLLTRNERSPHHGINYAEVNWREYDTYVTKDKVENDDGTLILRDGFRMRDSCSMTATRPFVFKDEQWNLDIEYKDIFRNYYDGIKANYNKSKYFHWFLILETIEYSDYYKREFDEALFEESEMQIIEDFANKFKANSVKYSAILNLKTRTAKSRKEKLYEMLRKIGVEEYQGTVVKHEMSLATIGQIIDSRNALFHKSKIFDEVLLWEHLFPIVRAVVELSIQNPDILE